MALMPRRHPSTVLLAALAGLLPLLAGCGKDASPTGPAPRPVITPLALDRAWPHKNGATFSYRYVVRTATPPGDNLYANPADVPDVTLEQIAALLAAPPPFAAAQEETNGYVLAFQDSAMAGNGERGQNLVGTVTAYPFPRPDGIPPAAAAGIGPDPPLFLGGGVWRQEADRIIEYADLPSEITWVFLQGSLSDRTPWSVEVQPGLTGAVLYARAYQSVTVDIANIQRDDALDVHYLLDHGIESVSQAGGGVLYRRRFSYARVIWAADAGPLYLYERRGLTAGDPPTLGVAEATLLLEDAVSPAASFR